MERITRMTVNLSTVAVSILLMLLCWQPATAIEYVEQASTQDKAIPAWVWDKPVWDVCEYEDSNNCVWNAKRRGIGGGTSYVATSKGRVIYIKHWQAYRLLHPNYGSEQA